MTPRAQLHLYAQIAPHERFEFSLASGGFFTGNSRIYLYGQHDLQQLTRSWIRIEKPCSFAGFAG